MDEKFIKILKEMKNIRPDTDYSKQSKIFILNSERGVDIASEVKFLKPKRFGDVLSVFSFYKPALVTGIAIFLITMAAGIYYVNNTLSQKNLVVKASEVNASIQVRLNEIKYLLENKSDLGSTSILTIQIMLEKAANNLREVSASGSESNNLSESLDKIKAAEEVLYQIDMLLKK